MLTTATDLRCCDAYLRSAGRDYHLRPSDSISPRREGTQRRARALVVEFRDEVYAGLKAQLEEYGFEVERAESGATVALAFNRFTPDLILINEDMPDESGWVITGKLRLTRHRQPVWLYTIRQPRLKAEWKAFSGVDEVIEYGGVLIRLVQHVRNCVANWLGESDDAPSLMAQDRAATLLVA